MRKILVTLLWLLVFVATPAQAQDLVPATSEDIMEFDRQLESQKSDNFGQQVKEEAKKLKDADKDKGSSFGKWVSSQRKKSEKARPSSAKAKGPSPTDKDKGKKKK